MKAVKKIIVLVVTLGSLSVFTPNASSYWETRWTPTYDYCGYINGWRCYKVWIPSRSCRF